jgi:uncharacterized protein (DUF952 family)
LSHIAAASDWQRSPDAYVPAGFAKDGVIHCSTREQVLRVANAVFAGRSDLALLMIDADLLSAAIKYGSSNGGAELFPHLYAPLPREAVVGLEPLRPREDGKFDPMTVARLLERGRGSGSRLG